MESISFPSCCTARILIGMGASATADHRASRESVGATPFSLATNILGYILSAKSEGLAQLVAVVNDEQKAADTILRRLGSTHTTWMESANHTTKTRTHILPVREIYREVLYPVVPRDVPSWGLRTEHLQPLLNSLIKGL
jgi:hypothetical protein